MQKLVCERCGFVDVKVRADVMWDTLTQSYVVVGVILDHVYCYNCKSKTSVKFEEVSWKVSLS